MVANIYNNKKVQTPEVERAMCGAWRSMNTKEGWLDSKGKPTPHDGGVIYQDNEMTFVALVADEGGVAFAKRGPTLRDLADRLGYEKSANCKAMVVECTNNDLLMSEIKDDQEWLMVTEYGWETLARWEHQKQLDAEIGYITDADLKEVRKQLQSIASFEWGKGTLFHE